MKKQQILGIFLAGWMAVCAAGCGNAAPAVGQEQTSSETVQTSAEITEPASSQPVTEAEETLPAGMQYSYLTGELVSEAQASARPVALMIGNTQEAMPQYGLSKAGVIYEAPAEGGINRLMPVFEDYSGLDRIGSLRSARTYFCFFSREFDAVLGHFGEAYYAQQYLNSPGFEHFDCLSDSGSELYFRTSDRPSPHNAFASSDSIAASFAKTGYSLTHSADYQGHFQFAEEEETLESGTAALKVNPNYPINEPWFEYDSATGLYKRYQYGGPQIDAAANSQLAVTNILIQACGTTYYDNTPYLNMDVHSGGNGYYITRGKAVPVTWSKDSEWGQTHYYGPDGQEIQLNPGKTWVCVVQAERLGGVTFQ